MDVTRFVALLLAAASALFGETFKLYLNDGDYHVVREYQVQGDRVRYYSTERGEWEEIVGKALKGRRNNIVLATKVHGPMGEDPNQQGSSRRWIMQAVEASLRRLQTDHIDLYQIHASDSVTPIEETLRALDTLVQQ